jgi:phenylacetic acid degradation operon negative regulatory protein
MKLTPKKIILDLLMAGQGAPLSSKEAVAACLLFDLAEVSTRVALTRLQAEGLIQSIRRGVYLLGPHAQQVANDVASWRSREQLTQAWHDDYVTVYTQSLGRTDRPALVRRERALNLWGFRQLEKGLYVRPNNLSIQVNDLHTRLNHLGLEPEALLCRSTHFDTHTQTRILDLWPEALLNQHYTQSSQQLLTWMAKAHTLPLAVAAQESLLLGSQAIHDVVFDPLLPDAMIDVAVRTKFFQTVRQFDDVGQQIWGILRQHSFDAQAASIQQVAVFEQTTHA